MSDRDYIAGDYSLADITLYPFFLSVRAVSDSHRKRFTARKGLDAAHVGSAGCASYAVAGSRRFFTTIGLSLRGHSALSLKSDPQSDFGKPWLDHPTNRPFCYPIHALR
jgi:hypothetical protein